MILQSFDHRKATGFTMTGMIIVIIALIAFTAVPRLRAAADNAKCVANLRELGAKWSQAVKIDGMIFLGTNIMDKNFKAVEWTREWIAQVGGENLK